MVKSAATAGRKFVIAPTTVTTEAASTTCFVVSGNDVFMARNVRGVSGYPKLKGHRLGAKTL